MAEAYNNTETIPETNEDFFAFLVVPPVTYFRNLQTKARGVLREDSFLRVTSTQEEAESVRVYLKENYGVDTQVVPLSVNFTGDSNVSLSLRRLVDVEAIDREPDVGDLIQYTGERILINGVDSPRYSFGRIDTQYVDEHSSNLYYTNSKVSSHIAATSLDTLTPDEGDNSTKIATTEYVKTAIGNLIDNAPSTLDTLNELAAAINDDADFHTTLLSSNATIQTELDATQTGAGLTGTGLYVEDSNTTYLQSASSLKNADSILDSEIFAIQNELDATQTGAGLDTDGSYIAKTDANYIDEAVSLQDADEKLDAQAKVNADAISAETTARQNADSTLQSNIDSEASTRATEDAALGTRIDNLHAVASSGSYNDLLNKPSLFSGSYNDLSNKPSLFSGSYNDLTDVPSGTDLSGYATETYVDNAVFSGNYNDLSNKPSLFSGSYNDLTDVPSGTDLSGYATETYVDNAVSNLVDSAPSALNTLNELAAALGDDSNFSTTITNALAGKANTSDIFSGNYNDLTNKPSIPSAYSLPTASSSTKGGITTNYTTNGRNYAVQMSGTNAYVNVPWVSSSGGGFSGSYNDLTDKPTLFSGSYTDLSNKPTIPSAYTLPAATSQALGGVKVSFSNGNLYISTS